VGTDVCRYAGAVEALGQLVHAPIDKIDHAAEQIGAPMRLGRPASVVAPARHAAITMAAMYLARIISIRPAWR
jgi:hypothetical protein